MAATSKAQHWPDASEHALTSAARTAGRAADAQTDVLRQSSFAGYSSRRTEVINDPAAAEIDASGDARRAGAKAAHETITAQADAGMSADQIDASAEVLLAARFDNPNRRAPDAFYAAYDDVAGLYAAELRELDAE